MAPPMPAHPPAAAPRTRRGLSGASVPQILLGLGALCVLVAAVTFLVIAWSWLGIGGRTAVLVGLTVVTGGAAVWLTRKGLRIGGEAFAVISVGLLALDVAGAADAGWLGSLDAAQTTAACGAGAAVGALALVLATRPRALLLPQILAPLAALVALVGTHAATEHHGVTGLVFTLALLGLAWGARRLALPILAWVALGAMSVAWCTLLVSGIDWPFNIDHLWLHAAVWPMVVAGLVLLLVPAIAAHPWVRVGAFALSGIVLTSALVLPAIDESAGNVLATLLAATAVWSAVLLAAPEFWRRVAAAPAVLAALVPAGLSSDFFDQRLTQAGVTTSSTSGFADRIPASTDLTFHPALLVLSAVVGALFVVGLVALFMPRRRAVTQLWPAGVALVLAAAMAAVSAYSVPRVLVVLPLIGAAVALALRPGRVRGLFPAAALALMALAIARPSGGLTVLVLAGVVAVCVWQLIRHDGELDTYPVAALTPFAAAQLAWSLGDLIGVPTAWQALLCTIAVAALGWWRKQFVLEVAALVALVPWTMASIDSSEYDLSIIAVHLTAVGAVLVAHALLHADRRPVAWFGGALLAMATWARLADLGVEQVEAYTLPTALVLIALGLWHLRRHPSSSTARALVPGLSLATIPTLLVVLNDPLSWRAVVLGVACLGLVLGGAIARWSGPLVVGAIIGAALVVRELQPFAADVPPWVLIGTAGAALITVGLTWESRMRDLRRGASYLAALR